ncbi:hypothetical protein ACFVJK_37170 [Streptomyces sp. NPDC127172]|uniref:hypothetical protein n=1 Tax=Streptomyces sp. NPDC127172 TaxID=3345382 RepID=UPI0036270362
MIRSDPIRSDLLWSDPRPAPVSDAEPYTFAALEGHLTPDEVGTAVMSLAACDDVDPTDDRPPRPDDPLGGFLHGLLTMDPLFAAGGPQVTVWGC